jgi:hypothetical protein
MKSEIEQVPPSSTDFFVLAEIAASRASATRHPKTARVLKRMARDYLARAKELGGYSTADEDLSRSGQSAKK